MLRWINNFPVKVKTFAASAVLVACLAGLGSSAFITLSHWQRQLDQLSQTTLPEQVRLRNLRDRVSDLQLDVFRYVAWSNNSVNDRVLADLRFDINGKFNLINPELQALADQAKVMYPQDDKEIISNWSSFSQAASDTIEIAQVDPPMGTMMLGGTDDRFQRLATALREISDNVGQQAQLSTQSLVAEAKYDELIIGIVGILGILLGLAITVLITRSIVIPIQAVTATMARVARGETSGEFKHDGRRDEIGQMLVAISIFRDKIERDNDALVAREQQLITQNMRFDAAISNMPQGLCMFDATQRLIVCNKQYADLYGLNEEQTKPGTTLRAILEHRIARGAAPDDPESYINDRINEVTVNKPYQITNGLRNGRYVSVAHKPMAEGGWVATHEDVTEAKRREETFRLLFEGNPVPMWVIDRESLRFLAINDAAVTHYGYSCEQFMSMTVTDLRPVEDRERFAHFIHALSNDHLVENIAQHSKADGSTIDVCVYSRALAYAGHNARLAAIHDITKAKLAEDELRRTKKFLDAVIEYVPLPIVVKSAPSAAEDARDFRFNLVNRAYEELMGVSRDRIIGKTTHELYPKERADDVVSFDNKALHSDQAVLISDHSFVTPNNGTRLVTAKKVAIRGGDGKPEYLLTLMDDVTERRQAEQQIAHLARSDPLTDLPNRAVFNECLSSTLRLAEAEGRSFAIMCMDLDDFKEVNDVYGHTVGDLLLCQVADRLRAVADGIFVARLGGDEFTIIAENEGRSSIAKLAERLNAAFTDDFELDGRRLRQALSIGVAIYPDDGTDAKTLMNNADAALYRAKADNPGSAIFFEAEMGARLHEQAALQADLKLAIQRNELSLHYQPQLTMSGEITGFEALARWNSPTRGMVLPGEFIPLAEESSLILVIGEWVMREACREAASWDKPLKIAVNVSPIQFRHGDLPRLVHSVLLETGLAPSRLELEITEGVLIDEFSRAVSILRRLKSLGVQIALDDFGTGYSSLSYLHSFPFDKIKIDRTFISDLEDNRHSIAIVRAVIGLCRSLNIPILAEGVETQAQHAFLAQEGCNEVQGYLTGRPLQMADYASVVGRKAVGWLWDNRSGVGRAALSSRQ